MNEYLSSISTCNDYSSHKAVLSEYIKKENSYREVFAQPDKDPNNECLIHPENMVIPVFENLESFKYRQLFAEEEKEEKLFKLEKRAETGNMSVNDRDTFAANFNILTEGMFDDFNWSNVVAAGGCVSACLLPVPEDYKTKKEKRKYFHDIKYGGIDVDLFIYGLDEEKAKEKMSEIAHCISDNCLYPVRYVRTSHSITIVNQYPYINIQIILRLYKSPPEVIMGFDIDSCALYYDGNNVYSLPRSHHAIVSQYNTIDMSRRSPTYESRLAKYADRGYEVLYPELNRSKVDPLIFEKGFEEIQGLSRLLVLERYKDPSIYKYVYYYYIDERYNYLIRKIMSSGKPLTSQQTKIFNNPRMKKNLFGERISDYSTVFFPWGPEWTAKKIANSLKIKDFLVNSEWFNHDNKKSYHTHPCFVGKTIEDTFIDQCGKCPEWPEDEKNDLKDKYVMGEIHFIVDNPGCQSIGSFHPITEGDWTDGAYINELTHDFMLLCNEGDINGINKFLVENKDYDINKEDVLGRSCLIINSFNGNCEVLKLLLDLNVNIHLSLRDGRSAFHIACCYNHIDFLKILLEYNSKLNVEDENFAKRKYDLTKPDKNFQLSPIEYAMIFGRVECVQLLLQYGVPVTLMKNAIPQFNSYYYNNESESIIFWLLITFEFVPDKAKKIFELFVQNGFKCASFFLYNMDHSCDYELTKLFMQYDPNCKKLINLVKGAHKNVPLIMAINSCNPDLFKLLIDNGAKLKLNQKDIDEINQFCLKIGSSYTTSYQLHNFCHPITILLQHINMIQEKEKFDKIKEMLEYVNNKNLINWKEVENIEGEYINLYRNMMKNIENYKDNKTNNLGGRVARGMSLLSRNNNVGEISKEELNNLSLNPKDSYKYFIYQNYTRIEKENNEIEDMKLKKMEEKYNTNNTNNSIVKEQVNGSEFLMKFLKDNNAFNNNIYQTVDNERKLNNQSSTSCFGYNNNRFHEKYSFGLINTQCTAYYYSNNTTPISTSQQPEYEKLYDAIWRKDINTVLHLTNTVNNSKPLLIGVIDSFGFTPLTLALYVGDMKLVSVILEVCLKQYTPLKKVDTKKLKGSEYKINNFDILNGSVFDSIGINNNNNNNNNKRKEVDQHQDLGEIISLLSPIKFISNYYLLPAFDKSIKIDDYDVENINSYTEKYILPTDAVQCAMMYLSNSDFIKFVEMIKDYGRKGLIKENIPENEIETNLKLNCFNQNNMYNMYNNNDPTNLLDIAMCKGVDMIKYLLEYHGVPSPENPDYTNRLTHLSTAAIKYNQFEVLKFLLSDEPKKLLQVYCDKHNPDKESWEKFDLFNKISEQFDNKYNKHILYAICKYKRPEMLKELLLSGKYFIGNKDEKHKKDEKNNKMEEESDEKEGDNKKNEDKENSFEYIINKAINICIKSKSYECLELILSNNYGTIMKYEHILTIYEMNIQNVEYIKNKINSYPKDELLRIYSEDKEFKIVLHATIKGYESLKILLDSGYKLDQHNIFYQTICKYLYNSENENTLVDTFIQLLERYKEENMYDLLINEEDINGDVLFDTIVNNSIKNDKKMNSKIFEKIENKEIIPNKRIIIPDSIVRSLNEEQNKRKRVIEDNYRNANKRGKYNKNKMEEDDYEDRDSDDDDYDNYNERFTQMIKNKNSINISFNVIEG